MSAIHRLVMIGFDSLENHCARYEETVGLFEDCPDSLASDRMEEHKAAYLAKWPPFHGYDGETYPQWRVVVDPIL